MYTGPPVCCPYLRKLGFSATSSGSGLVDIVSKFCCQNLKNRNRICTQYCAEPYQGRPLRSQHAQRGCICTLLWWCVGISVVVDFGNPLGMINYCRPTHVLTDQNVLCLPVSVSLPVNHIILLISFLMLPRVHFNLDNEELAQISTLT